MASTRLKKKKARAVARNQARHKSRQVAAEVVEDGGKAQPVRAPKRGIEIVKAAEMDALGKPARFIEARHALPGKQYVLWSKRDVVEFTGEIRRKTQGSYSESVPGDQVEYMFQGYGMLGDRTQPFGYAPYYPLRDDATEVARIMERFYYKQNLAAQKANQQLAKYAPKSVEDPKTGEIVERPARVKTPRPPGAGTDPRTGCKLGTTSHRVGEIMLATGLGPKQKDACVAKLHTMLKEQFDDKKALNLARSWYATLKKNKPTIYAPTGAAKKAAEVKE